MKPLCSSLLSERHFLNGFSTRQGGVSAPPFQSANLGRGLGDSDEAVAENHRRLAEAIGYHRIFELSQVHGMVVREVRADEDPVSVRIEEGDALIAREAGVAVGVRTADCVPLLLAHPNTGHVAAVHAGWRGVESNIAHAAVVALGHPAHELLAAIGPHIRREHFEVGEDVAIRLEAASVAKDTVDRSGPRPRVDLACIVRAQLSLAGVRSIDDVGGDTAGEPDRFFSHRRDAERSGRQLSVIVARGPVLFR